MSTQDDDGEQSPADPDGDRDRSAPAAVGFTLLAYVPTTVIGFVFLLAGTSDFRRYLTDGYQQFPDFASSLFILTLGITLLLPSLGAAYVRAGRAASDRR